MSLGAPLGDYECYDYWLSNFVDDFVEQYNTTVVVSAGNSGPDSNTIGTPGCVENVITVGATGRLDENFNVAPYSSRGPVDYSNIIKPDIVAPGGNPSFAQVIDGHLYFFPEGIASVETSTNMVYTGVLNQYLTNRYQRMSGTSMAAPHVTGTVALMLNEHPSLTPAEIKNILHDTADFLEGQNAPNYDAGYGFLDTYAAVQMASIWPEEDE